MSKTKEHNKVHNPEMEAFIVGQSSLDFFLDRPYRQPEGVILLCISGWAELVVNMQHCHLQKNMQVILLPNEICMISNKSDDFNVAFFSYSDKIFREATFQISPDYFGYLKEHFYVTLPTTVFEANVDYLRLVHSLYIDRENRFREKMVVNFLQNYILNSCDKIFRYHSSDEIKESDRQNKLFKQFVLLVHTHSTTIREVNFYANELFISTRYLSAITQKNIKKSAKAFIDDCVIQEIKLLLHSTDITIQEIADRLNFPDQSYLGRYFKKHTGISPKEYRKRQ